MVSLHSSGMRISLNNTDIYLYISRYYYISKKGRDGLGNQTLINDEYVDVIIPRSVSAL